MFKKIRNQLTGLLFVLLGCASLLFTDGDGTACFVLALFGLGCFFTKADLFDYSYLEK